MGDPGIGTSAMRFPEDSKLLLPVSQKSEELVRLITENHVLKTLNNMHPQ